MTQDNLTLKGFLKALTSFSESINELEKYHIQLGKNLWPNYEIEYLKKEHIKNACDKFLNNQVSAKELEKWADLVEGLDSLKYEEEFNDQISEILFLLSNPDINGEITKDKVRQYLKIISRQSLSSSE